MAGMRRALLLLLFTLLASAAPAYAEPLAPWAVQNASAGSGLAEPLPQAHGASVLHPATIRFTIPYRNEWSAADYLLEFGVHVNRASMRYTSTGGAVRTLTTGMLVPVADRPVRTAIPALPLPRGVRPGTALAVVITTEVDRPAIRAVPLLRLRAEEAGRRRYLDYPLLIFAGIFIALAFGNLTFYASFRSRAYVAYSGVMLSAALIALRSSPDLFWAWLLPHESVRFAAVYDFSVLAYGLCLVDFTRRFLSTRQQFPRYDRFLLAMSCVFVASLLVAQLAFTGAHVGQIELVDLLYVVFILVPFAGGILAVRANYRPAFFYVVAFSGVFVSLMLMNTLAFFGRWYELLIFAGITWEGVWLVAALGDRVRRLDRAALDLAREQAAAALHDTLTGLPNRRKIEMELRDIPVPFALLSIDIDHLSVVNSTTGHEAGDELIVDVARRLERFVAQDDALARVSSDEFALLLRSGGRERATEVAHEIVSAVADEPFERDGRTLRATVSVGCVVVTRTLGPSTILAIAEAACDTAKAEGRNRAYVASGDEAAEESTRVAKHWARRISEALEDDRFALFYQPIVPLASDGGALHIEILVRLVETDGTIVETAQFLPAAERYSLAADIDRWVIRKALPLVAPMLDDGRLDSVSLNLSGNALQDPGLAEFIAAEMDANRIEGKRLCFEITETVVLSMLDRVRSLVTALRRRGIRFALDDFGTGTSSLSVLRDLHVDYLKIDGAFVRDCATNEVDAAMLKTIRDLANALGLRTIAEYAKDDATVARLREIGIDYAQGWAYAKAQPIESLSAVPAS